jgi:hypothetical protein
MAIPPFATAALIVGRRSVIFLTCARGAFGRKAYCLDLDAGAQLQDVEHVMQRGVLVEIHPIRRAHVIEDEGAGPLAGDHQPVGFQSALRTTLRLTPVAGIISSSAVAIRAEVCHRQYRRSTERSAPR